jgi:predicted nucleic acid-binding protein
MACSIVWAEVSAALESASGAADAMGRLGVGFSAMAQDDALSAGQVWREYRRRGGARSRVIADFLIGAHPQARADRLLSRDWSLLRSYFRQLRVVDPSATA